MAKIQITFTGPTPAPSNGYRVQYKKTSVNDYTALGYNPTSSPIVISGLENGVSYNVLVESDCGNETFSPVVAVIATPTKTFSICPANFSGTEAGSAYFTYPARYLDVFNNPTQNIQLNWNANDRPNRFTVYDENDNLVYSTGWVGQATYSGPWGASLNTASTGVAGFSRDPGSTFYKLLVEAGPASPTSPISDSWSASFSCA